MATEPVDPFHDEAPDLYGYWDEAEDLQGLPVLAWRTEPEPNYDNPIGTCANCGDTIFDGDGPTVHRGCERDFIAYLNDPANRI